MFLLVENAWIEKGQWLVVMRNVKDDSELTNYEIYLFVIEIAKKGEPFPAHLIRIALLVLLLANQLNLLLHSKLLLYFNLNELSLPIYKLFGLINCLNIIKSKLIIAYCIQNLLFLLFCHSLYSIDTILMHKPPEITLIYIISSTYTCKWAIRNYFLYNLMSNHESSAANC